MDILLGSEVFITQGWIVDGGDEEVEFGSGMDEEALEVDSSRNFEVRELHEEYFVVK